MRTLLVRVVGPQLVSATTKWPATALMLALSIMFLWGSTLTASAAVIVQDFFGSTNDLANGTLTRHDAAGNTVFMQTGQGPTLVGIDGLRAQFPDTSNEVWRAPGGQHAATWFFAAASTDPFEPVTPGDTNNLVLVAGADAGTGGHLAALLPLTPPATTYKVSADMIPEGGDVRDSVAIGLTSSLGTLNSNFESFGQAWLVLKMNSTGLGPTTWELHTNGTTGSFLTGSTTLSGFTPLELTYDPVAHLISGSINGVSTPTMSYTATGIVGVGMQAVQHISFGIADHFAVQTVAQSAAWNIATGGKCNATGNWSTNSVPDSGTAIVRLQDALTTVSAGGNVIDLEGANRTVKQIDFLTTSAGVSYNVSNGTVTLGDNANPGAITVEAANLNDQTISAGLVYANSPTTITNASSKVVSLTGAQNWSGHSLVVNAGTLKFDASVNSINTSGASLTIGNGATVELAGTQSATSDGIHHVSVNNSGDLDVMSTSQRVGAILGSGSTNVLASAELTASDIIQNTLAVDGTAGSHATVTIGASDVFGNPLIALGDSAPTTTTGGGASIPEPSSVLLIVIASAALWFVSLSGHFRATRRP